MYDAIAAYQEVFLYFSLSLLAIGCALGIIVALVCHYYRFSTGNANVFVHTAILEAYTKQYSYQAFPMQKPKVKVYVNRRNQITIALSLLKCASQDFERIEKDLSELFSFCLGYQKPLFLEIAYK